MQINISDQSFMPDFLTDLLNGQWVIVDPMLKHQFAQGISVCYKWVFQFNWLKSMEMRVVLSVLLVKS